jgi:hypothetical protein
MRSRVRREEHDEITGSSTTANVTKICANELIIIIYLVSFCFTISEAIYRLTLGFHGTASPIYTYTVTFFYFIKPFILDHV